MGTIYYALKIQSGDVIDRLMMIVLYDENNMPLYDFKEN